MDSLSIQILARPIRILAQGLVDLVYPPLCALCERRLEQASQQICPACLNEFNLYGKTINEFSTSGPIHIDRAWPLLKYDEKCQHLIHQLKYSRRRKLVPVLLNYFRSDIITLLEDEPMDVVIPVPLHPRKLRERGYNQVEDFSLWMARTFNYISGAGWVRRIRYTQSQTRLSADERQLNIANAFSVIRPDRIADQHILIVDDVLTTGATSNAMAKCIRESGAKSVALLTLATPEKDSA